MITAALVKELREKTGAGMMDCKKALTETDGDIAKAIDWLRQKGISKAAEGLSNVVIDGNKAIVVEINSETDFVAKNEQFLELLDKTCKTLINANATSVEEALTVAVDGGTLNDLFVNATATIGEKITLRRFEVLTKTDDQVFGAYMHMGGKISAVVVANGAKADVAKDMAMQVASMNPQYVSRANMPAEVVEHETNVQKEILKNDPKLASKPEKVLAGIIEGRVSKTLQEMCLVDQLFFKNQDIKCGQYLKENGMEVVSFVKYTVGEGLEKREENFAEEVAKQMAK